MHIQLYWSMLVCAHLEAVVIGTCCINLINTHNPSKQIPNLRLLNPFDGQIRERLEFNATNIGNFTILITQCLELIVDIIRIYIYPTVWGPIGAKCIDNLKNVPLGHIWLWRLDWWLWRFCWWPFLFVWRWRIRIHCRWWYFCCWWFCHDAIVSSSKLWDIQLSLSNYSMNPQSRTTTINFWKSHSQIDQASTHIIQPSNQIIQSIHNNTQQQPIFQFFQVTLSISSALNAQIHQNL